MSSRPDVVSAGVDSALELPNRQPRLTAYRMHSAPRRGTPGEDRLRRLEVPGADDRERTSRVIFCPLTMTKTLLPLVRSAKWARSERSDAAILLACEPAPYVLLPYADRLTVGFRPRGTVPAASARPPCRAGSSARLTWPSFDSARRIDPFGCPR